MALPKATIKIRPTACAPSRLAAPCNCGCCSCGALSTALVYSIHFTVRINSKSSEHNAAFRLLILHGVPVMTGVKNFHTFLRRKICKPQKQQFLLFGGMLVASVQLKRHNFGRRESFQGLTII